MLSQANIILSLENYDHKIFQFIALMLVLAICSM